MASSSSKPVELFMADFCPFAQRAWIAFLEKEEDPANPKLYKHREVNYYNRDHPETKEFLAVHNTVPAGYDPQGNPLRESLPIAYWADEQWPERNPLQPSSDEGKAKMKALISRFTEGELSVGSATFQALMNRDSAKVQTHWEQLLRALTELGREVKANGGPYLLGAQFTIADIALFPLIERAQLVLPHFRSLAIPETDELRPFHQWYAAVAARPAVRITTADRLPRSVAVHPFAATQRAAYLVESSEGMAHGVKDIFRVQLAHAPAGVSSSDLAAAIRQRDAEEKAKAKSA